MHSEESKILNIS